jgi:HEPN domain-containing protein
VRKDPNYDGVCFHCQQCVEKYLKAKLEEAGTRFPRTHDLTSPLALALNVEPQWVSLQSILVVLNPYAIAYRYPGFDASQSDAMAAIKGCRQMRKTVNNVAIVRIGTRQGLEFH